MVPNEAHQYTGMVQLLLHFQWKWVGLITVGDDQGEKFVQTLTHLFSQNGICPAFTQKLVTHSESLDMSLLIERFQDTSTFLIDTDVNIFVINAETGTMMTMQWVLMYADLNTTSSICKVWVMTAHWDFTSETFLRNLDIQIFHGSLSFAIHSNELQGFQSFLHRLTPYSDRDGFIRVFWEQAFDCFFPDTDRSGESKKSCTGEEKLETLPGPLFEMSMTGQSYSIYNAVYAVAHAFHTMHSSRNKHTGTRLSLVNAEKGTKEDQILHAQLSWALATPGQPLLEASIHLLLDDQDVVLQGFSEESLHDDLQWARRRTKAESGTWWRWAGMPPEFSCRFGELSSEGEGSAWVVQLGSSSIDKEEVVDTALEAPLIPNAWL
ncbi:UNVERIFIED_CONTAM: hypothetical protein K2H54_033633 [Gekko kuhli]